MLRTFFRFFVSVVVAAGLNSLVSTQLVLAEVSSFGMTVSFTDRLMTTALDLFGLGVTLLVLIAPSFLVGFVIANYAHRFIGGNRQLWYSFAGFSSFPMTLYSIKFFMGVTLLASARTSFGMLLAGICCMVAGWLFAKLTSVSKPEELSNEK
ncbi:MAG: hypothetical protein COA86_11265 [Kangiella sp.]|nr:MAG: hypothetical protein COA86_11265 [Kangiella sp.]